MPTKVSKFIDPEADRQQPPSMEGCGMSDSREAFAFCFTDVNGKPSEFCDHPKHAAEGDTRIRTPLYTHPASSDEWIKCSERLPEESDGDCHGTVWVYNKGLSWVEISDLEDVKFISDYTHWMPTNLVRPEPPKQEEGQ